MPVWSANRKRDLDQFGRKGTRLGEVEVEGQAIQAGISRGREGSSDVKLALDFKTLTLQKRIAELKEADIDDGRLRRPLRQSWRALRAQEANVSYIQARFSPKGKK